MIKRCLMLMVLLLTGATVSAQQPEESMFKLVDTGMATSIDRTNGDNDGSVTVEWAYADPLRLTVAYRLASTISLADSPILTTADGAEFAGRSNRSVPDSKSHDLIVDYYPMAAVTDAKSGQRSTVENYFSQLDPLPQTLDLTFSVQVRLNTGQDRTYSIPFSLPLHRAVKVEGEQHTQFGGVMIWVDQVMVAPSQTQFILCYTLPDPSLNWELHPVVILQKSLGFYSSGRSTTDLTDPSKRCDLYSYDVLWDGQPTQLTIAVDQMIGKKVDSLGGMTPSQTRFGPWNIWIDLPANQPSTQS